MTIAKPLPSTFWQRPGWQRLNAQIWCRLQLQMEPASLPGVRSAETPRSQCCADRSFVEAKLAEGLSPTTVGHCVRQLSTFFADIIEQGHAPSNPVASLPRSTRRLYRSTYDTQSTPFLNAPMISGPILGPPRALQRGLCCGSAGWASRRGDAGTIAL